MNKIINNNIISKKHYYNEYRFMIKITYNLKYTSEISYK